MNDNKNNFSETVDNNLHEGTEYDIFSENSTEGIEKVKNLSRDYLKYLYNEEMDFLNKDVRMTRSQYIKSYADIEESFEKEKKHFKQYVAFSAIAFAVIMIFGIWALHEWYLCWNFLKAVNAASGRGEVSISNAEFRGYWAMTGIYGCLGWIAVLLGLSLFFFFGYGYIKKIKLLEKNKVKALKTLEERKRDAMILGQYDTSR